MLTKSHINAALEQLTRFSRDSCEEICDGDVECLRKCHAGSLRQISDLLEGLELDKTTPAELQEMVESFRRRPMKT